MQFRQDDLTLRERITALDTSSSQWAEEQGVDGVGVRTYFLQPLGVFCHVYLRQGRWRQGTHGLIAAIIEAYAAFVAAAKLWEKWWVKRRAAELKQKTLNG